MFRFGVFLLVVLLSFGASAQSLKLNDRFAKVQEALQKDPDNLNLKMEMAYLFSEGREPLRAIEIYKEVVQKDAQNLRALNELCYLYTFTRQKDLAYATCKKVVEVDGSSALAWDNLGLSHFKFGDLRDAFAPFVAASELSPNSELPRIHMGNVLLALQEYDLAVLLFEKALQGAKVGAQEKALLHYGLYKAYRGTSNYEAAYANIKKTYEFSQNPLYLGKMTSTFMKVHEPWFFLGIGLMILWGCHYLGKRLNRFLKNED